jgi:hypothetical protein
VHVEAVLLTGWFGVGKSTIAAEMADFLEDAGVPYAALDLDWLTWCNVGDGDRASEHAMLLHNLGAVVASYRAGGVRYFVLARWIRDRNELAGLIATMAMPLHTVELVVPLDEIRRPDGEATLPSRWRGWRTGAAWASRSSQLRTIVPFARSRLTSFGGWLGLPAQVGDIAPIWRSRAVVRCCSHGRGVPRFGQCVRVRQGVDVGSCKRGMGTSNG